MPCPPCGALERALQTGALFCAVSQERAWPGLVCGTVTATGECSDIVSRGFAVPVITDGSNQARSSVQAFPRLVLAEGTAL